MFSLVLNITNDIVIRFDYRVPCTICLIHIHLILRISSINLICRKEPAYRISFQLALCSCKIRCKWMFLREMLPSAGMEPIITHNIPNSPKRTSVREIMTCLLKETNSFNVVIEVRTNTSWIFPNRTEPNMARCFTRLDSMYPHSRTENHRSHKRLCQWHTSKS